MGEVSDWIERTVFLEYGDDIVDTDPGTENTDIIESLGDWGSVDAAIEEHAGAVRDHLVEWSQSWEYVPGEDFEDFYAREIDAREPAEGGDSYTLQAAADGEPMNCLSRAISGAIMAELTGKDDLYAVVGWDDGPDIETGIMDPGRAHVVLTDGIDDPHSDVTVYGQDGGEYDNSEVIDVDQLAGLYLGTVAHEQWHDGRAEATSEVYAPMIDGIADDSQYLSRQSEQADQDFYIA